MSGTSAWDPFDSRVGFDFTKLHYVKIQSSEGEINTALNIWAASVLKYNDHPPWANAKDLYSTIDQIQHGNAPWRTHIIRYTGPLPAGKPPKWMTQSYELCARDTRIVLHNQLESKDLKGKVNLIPYRQFNAKGKRVYSNFMSGDYAWKQAVRAPIP